MILLLLVLVVVLVAAVLLARRRYVWPSRLLRAARVGTPDNPGPAVVVQRQLDAGATDAYAYCYVLAGPGSADVGDHDTDKLVVRVDATPRGKLVTRVAPVDRQGRRTGRSRRLLTR